MPWYKRLVLREVIRSVCTQSEPAAPSSTVQALAMVRAGLGYLSACDAVSLGTAVQAETLVGLEQAEAQHTAARAKILAAFSAQQSYQADGQPEDRRADADQILLAAAQQGAELADLGALALKGGPTALGS